jgi:hypothetical protein
MKELLIILALIILVSCFPLPRASLWEGSTDSTLSLVIERGDSFAAMIIYPYFTQPCTMERFRRIIGADTAGIKMKIHFIGRMK